MATVTSAASGNWNTGATWVGGSKPADGDTAVIAEGHTVTFDADLATDGIDLAAMTVNGIFQADTAAGDYVLKVSGDITLGANGQFNVGSSGTAYPATCTFTVDFDGTGSSFETADGGKVSLYCNEPTYTYVRLSGDEAVGQTELSVDTDVTGDIWAAGDTVWIIGMDPVANLPELQEHTIAVGGIAAGAITVTAALSEAKSEGDYVCLVNRNIKVYNSTSNFINGGSGHTIRAQINVDGHILYTSHGNTISGGTMSATYILSSSNSNTISGGTMSANHILSFGDSNTISGGTMSATYILNFGDSNTISGGTMSASRILFSSNSNIISGGTMSAAYILYASHGNTISGGTMSATYIIQYSGGGNTFYNRNLDADTEVGDYTGVYMPIWGYDASYNHDATANAFKSWSKGGITLSEGTTVPAGYTQGYKLTCESATYHGFYQEAVTVMPGDTLTVTGYIKFADDHSSYLPRMQIVGPGADPLTNSGNSAFDTDSVASGTATGWQQVSVSYTNSSALPEPVKIRVIAKRASGSVYFAYANDFDYDTYESNAAGAFRRDRYNFV